MTSDAFTAVGDTPKPSRWFVGVIGGPGRSDPVIEEFLAWGSNGRTLVTAPSIEVRGSGEYLASGIGEGFLSAQLVPSATRPRTWVDLSQEQGASGIVRDGAEWVVFTDSLAVQGIYTRVIGDSILVSDQIDPLVEAGALLEPDWEAWAATLVLGAPLGVATHFREIRRLGPGTGIAVRVDGEHHPVHYQPRWLTYPSPTANPAELMDLLRAGFPGSRTWSRPPAVPLSGGWDSRILAEMACGHYRRTPEAWTLERDDGRTIDREYAAAVAQALEMKHHVVPQPEAGWPELAVETRDRVDHETWFHTWFTPLARLLRDRVPEILVGFGGGILVKGEFVEGPVMEGSEGGLMDRVFNRLGGSVDKLAARLDRMVAGRLVDSARDGFIGISDQLVGHVGQAAITVLLTRTSRVIAPAAMKIFGPEVRSWFPYLHPDFMAHTLSIDPRDKLDGVLSRELLRVAAPFVADLPSTNDPGRKPPRDRQPLQTGREAVDWMASSIVGSDLATTLFEPSAAQKMFDGTYSDDLPDFDAGRAIQAASLLADWERRYRHRLSLSTPPWVS